MGIFLNYRDFFKLPFLRLKRIFIQRIGHFTAVYLVAKPLIWREAEGDLVVIETSI